DSLYQSKFESFKAEVMRVPGVKSIASSTFIPGDEIYWTQNIRNITDQETNNVVVSGSAFDEDFIPSYNVKILAGKNFDKSMPGDRSSIILNEALSKTLNYKEPKDAIGKKVIFGGDTLEVAAVVEDFHQMSMKNQVAPLAMIYYHHERYYSLKIETP